MKPIRYIPKGNNDEEVNDDKAGKRSNSIINEPHNDKMMQSHLTSNNNKDER